MAKIDVVLVKELMALEGIRNQHPETGAGIDSGKSYLGEYTNRVFGAPYQLLDSVDKRFPSVNKYLGNEYLRNFTLNSPILYIKPGMPKYTGKNDGLLDSIKRIYIGTTSKNISFAESLLTEIASKTIFGKGSQLQRRMFGFSEDYYQYMQHVNYMCRSMASFLGLIGNKKFPKGTFCGKGNKLHDFKTMNWENYRMLSSSVPSSPLKQLKKMGGATFIGAAIGTAGDAITGIFKKGKKKSKDVAKALTEVITGGSSKADEMLGIKNVSTKESPNPDNDTATENTATKNKEKKTKNRFQKAWETSVTDVSVNKIMSVQFVVEPVQFEESINNNTKDSAVESVLDGVTRGIGSELAFITGSNVDLGLIEGITDFLGNGLESAATFIQGLVTPITGGFASNLFSGAMRSIKGQKMIYPKIYDSSDSSMNYTFTVNLYSPYGDLYNYYMNIVVPLMHLIALVAPRMVTSNSVKSPYIVQAYIPGQCTCQLGIIQNMQITKNPSTKHVSVHGFPLDIKVTFTIQELYNAMAVSPANDPASFLYNETLNDYMANLAGLMPAVDTYTKQRKNAFDNMNKYFRDGEYLNDIGNSLLKRVEGLTNPWFGR